MNISKIEIKNFKSFEDISVDLNDFNIIVGASASGKSNFIEAFRFLNDISHDFENGINKHGRHFFQNLNLKSNTPSCIKVVYSNGESFLTRIDENTNNIINYNSIEYELCIKFKDTAFKDITETVKFNFTINDKTDNELSQNTLLLINNDWEISAKFKTDEKYLDLEYFIPKSLLNIVNANLKETHELIINSPLSSIPIPWSNYFKTIKYYNFNPKLCNFEDDSEKAVLTEDGRNLPIVLENILKNENDQRKLLNLLNVLLPYIEEIDVLKFGDNRRIFKLNEKYSKQAVFSPFISDGTMSIIALVSALYFESSNIILIEEPERNIHPVLFITLVGMMKEVSKDKQIIITTHSPEILNYCNLEDIYLISRNKHGFSEVSKPTDNEDIKEFIDELGIGQVFVDDYLEFKNG